jgi:hypothetical protein
MSYHRRRSRSLLRRKSQKLLREIAADIALERHEVRDPETIENRKQQQRVLRWLSSRFGLLDQ